MRAEPDMTVCPHRHGQRCAVAAGLYEQHTACSDEACTACAADGNPRSVNAVTVSLAISGASRRQDRRSIAIFRTHGHLLQRVEYAQADGPARLAIVLSGNGVGSQLWRILAAIGVEHDSGCDCLAWAERLNAWGPAGCRLARTEIKEHLRDARAQLGWKKSVLAAMRLSLQWITDPGGGWWMNPADPYGSLVDEAIRRADKSGQPSQGASPSPLRTDTAAVACLYDPSHDSTRRAAYQRFADQFPRIGMQLYCREIASADPFVKENALNQIIRDLPPRITRVLWIDADLLILTPDYVDLLAAALDRHPVVQGFAQIRYAGPDGKLTTDWLKSAAFERQTRKSPDDKPGRTLPGGAWAARREILDQAGGLYDRVPTGSGDAVWAAAVFGDLAPIYHAHWPPAMLADVQRYVDRVHPLIPSYGCVQASVIHLYHGDLQARRYGPRNKQLSALGFDPAAHLDYTTDGALTWTVAAPEALRQEIRSYGLSNVHVPKA